MNLNPSHISETKLKPDSALHSLCAAHLAMHAVPAAIHCLGTIHLVPKAGLLNGAQTPLPSSLTPGRKGKLPRGCVWTKMCRGDQGDRAARTPVLSSASHGDHWGPPAPQHCSPLGQNNFSWSVLPSVCGPKEIDRKSWNLPMLVVVRMFNSTNGSCGQREGKVLHFVCTCGSLVESLGLSVGTGFAPAASPATLTESVWIILASEGGTKCSSESHVCLCVLCCYLRVWVRLLA